ncbi:MAG: DUF1549 domain-containing protein, partial [Pirellulaceae bacterium]|nr:DUF1549 domain-containing protein [Pirellulaceae bacterium]
MNRTISCYPDHVNASASEFRLITRGWTVLIMAAAHLFAATAYAQQPAAQVPQKQVPSDSDSAHFDQYLAPLLAIRCLSCHSGAEPKGELDLSTSEAAMRGGQSGVAIVPKELNHSRLWEYVDTDLMPPKKPLSPEEKSLIKNWIANGAAWGTSTIDPYRYSTDTRAGLDWWSLQPIVKTESGQVPGRADNDARDLKNSNADKSKNDHENVHKHAHKIDMLVRQQLSKVGLAPSPPADKRTLIRRVTFDLLGLPPTVEEVDAFLSDTSEHAYEKLVDRLLKSPHYGERWARHWLDVVRFGESNGFEYDEPRENFWSYRNWVIDAFNSDLPYDEFVRQQIAGDALAPDDLSSAAATGFLVAGPHNTTLPSNTKMRMAMAQDEMEDLVGIVGQAFLGLTINCARCHDHKFDPITQKEYYQLTSVLAGVTHGQRTIRVPLGPQERARVEKIDQRLRTIAADLELIRQPIRKRWLSQRNSERRPIVPPIALATWEFDGNLEDTRGNLNLKASGGAKIDRGALVLDGKRAMAFSDVLPQEIGEKTLEVWVQLATLDQRGGGLLTIEKADGSIFDSIVYAEQEPKKWMAGSNFFSRTKPCQNSSEEIEADQKVVHLAFVYQADGTIVAYRNGQPYGPAYDSGDLQRFDPAKARIVFGLRHSPVGGNRMLTGRIERAQFYARALTRDEVELSAAYSEQGNLPREMLIQQLQPEQRQSYIALEKEVVELNAEKQTLIDSEQRTLYTCVSTPPAKTHVLLRGDVGSPTEEVLPTGLRALASVPSQWHMSASASDRERRLQLAN